MKELELSKQDIIELIETFQRSGIGTLRIQQGEFCLKMEALPVQQVVVSGGGAAAAAPVAAGGTPVDTAAAEPEQPLRGSEVTSPIVGTFYAAPAPDQDPYVRTGSQVKKGDVLFIIESMKLMNEVISERDGTVTKVLVEDGQGVEYGQPILVIE